MPCCEKANLLKGIFRSFLKQTTDSANLMERGIVIPKFGSNSCKRLVTSGFLSKNRGQMTDPEQLIGEACPLKKGLAT